MVIFVGATEARRRFEELAEHAHAGKTIIITRWRKPIAKLIPLARASSQ